MLPIKGFSAVLAFCFLIHFCPAQQPDIDSLKSALPASTLFHKTELAYLIAGEYEKSLPDSALVYYKLGLTIAQQLKNDTLMAKGYNNIGYINVNSGEYTEALDYLFKALKIFENYKIDKSTITCLQYIGIAYGQQNMLEKAKEYAMRALTLAQASQNQYSTSTSMTMIGSIYYSQKNYPKALEYFEKSLKIMEAIGNKQGISDALNNVALIYEEQKNFRQALQYHLRSLSMAKELNDIRGVAASYHNLGMVYKSMGQYPLAVLYLDSCINTATEVDDKSDIKESYNTLSELYAETKQYQLAYETHLKYSHLNDTLMNEDNKRQFAEMSTKYETEKKDIQINLLNKDKEIQAQKIRQQQLVRNAFIGGFIIVLFSSILFFTQRNRISKEKKRSDELLLNILPEEVAEELKLKGSAEAKQFDMVTVMFTDFKGFTQISEKLSPGALVAEIDTCFKAFDHIITKYDIEKIKTIGDAYMCAGGLPVTSATHAVDIVNAAFEIHEFMEEHSKGSPIGKFGGARIGIHSGPVVAGIVGVKKFAYDIWGDTVNIASRLESSGEAGKVNISGQTYEMVKDKFKCTYRGKVEAKGKGLIDMYFVEHRI